MAETPAAGSDADTARLYTGSVEFGRTMSQASPVFVRPPLRGAGRSAAGRLIRHPVRGLRAVRRAGGVVGALSIQLWRETAVHFGYRFVSVNGGSPIPVRNLVRDSRPPLRPATRGDLTGLVIAQDEGQLIARVLESLRPWVRELLVVDGGSTDDTVEVAQRHGARVLSVPFRDDFAAQRNAGLDAVTTPWVLTLDCDEQIPPELGAVLLPCIARTDIEAVYLSRLNIVGDDPNPTTFPDLQPRLFRSHLRYNGRVHETIRPRTAIYFPVNGPQIAHHKSPLRHFRNSLHYNQINPGESRPNDLEWMRAEVARLERSDPGTGDLPKA